jgi:hypothetical protein
LFGDVGSAAPESPLSLGGHAAARAQNLRLGLVLHVMNDSPRVVPGLSPEPHRQQLGNSCGRVLCLGETPKVAPVD